MKIICWVAFLLGQISVACPYQKLVFQPNEEVSINDLRGKLLLRPPVSANFSIEKPVGPRWDSKAIQREEALNRWEEEVLRQAEKAWQKIGVQYEKIAYGPGFALQVLKEGATPLNKIYARAMRATGNKSDFKIVFSPRNLVVPRPGKRNNGLKLGEFSPVHNALHLPFQSLIQTELTEVFHHEFLHAVFHHFRNHGIETPFLGVFTSKDKNRPMWNGNQYTKFLSLEELAAFPLSLRLYELRLKKLREEDTKGFLKEISLTALTHALNARRVSYSLGHIIKHLEKDLRDVETSVGISAPDDKGNRSLSAKFEWANIQYEIKIEKASLKSISENDTDEPMPMSRLEDYPQPLKDELRKMLLAKLDSQRRMAKPTSETADNLVQVLYAYRNRPFAPFSGQDLQSLSDLLLAPRKLSLPFMKEKSR